MPDREFREVLTLFFGRLEGVEYRVDDRGHDTPRHIFRNRHG
jgi:hypothetical protein